jgi:hypothetical protein
LARDPRASSHVRYPHDFEHLEIYIRGEKSRRLSETLPKKSPGYACSAARNSHASPDGATKALHGNPKKSKKRKPTVMTGISVRQKAVADIAAAPPAPYTPYSESPDAMFGSNVFGLAAMKAHLPKDVFRSLAQAHHRKG